MTTEHRLTPARIEELSKQVNPVTGKYYTLADIGRMYGVTRQNVSAIRSRYGLHQPTPREIARDAFPWNVPTQFHPSWINRMLRDHGEYMASGGVGMAKYRLRELNLFYDKLEDNQFVVEFDPDYPPTDYNQFGGFVYQKREESDGDLIIRVNQHATVTRDGERIWRMPPERPLS